MTLYPARRTWIVLLITINAFAFTPLLSSRAPDYSALQVLDRQHQRGEMHDQPQPIYFAARPFYFAPEEAPDTQPARWYLLANWPALGATIVVGFDLHFWLAWNMFESWRDSYHVSQSWVLTVVFIVMSTLQWAIVGWLLGLRHGFGLRARDKPLQPDERHGRSR
jgi:hypothetical protein